MSQSQPTKVVGIIEGRKDRNETFNEIQQSAAHIHHKDQHFDKYYILS